MFGLFTSLALLGLAAVDPVGVGIMPILLLQKSPYRRSWIFLSGSFISLVLMGFVFAKGFGAAVLNFEHKNSWLVPSVKVVAGITLLCVAGFLYWQKRTGKQSTKPAGKVLAWLNLGSWQLFLLGAGLVAIQSILDVVFVIAMIRIGQYHISSLTLLAAVATYAIAALILQAAVIIIFLLTPSQQRVKMLAKVQSLLDKYSSQLMIVISLLLGLSLLALV